jgi:hypothetical protein
MEYWNGGKMEYWGSKADHGLILFSGPRRLYKNRPQSAKPIIPSFQYSIIPIVSEANHFYDLLAVSSWYAC